MDYLPTTITQDDGTQKSVARQMDLLRVGPGGRAGGLVCDHRPAMVYTHYWGGRTVPCVQNCEACEAYNRRVWHGYVQLYQPTTHTLAVVEMTEACRDTLLRFMTDKGSTRGARINLMRRGEARNGRLTLQIMQQTVREDLPEPIDLIEWLCHLWSGGGDRGRGLSSTERADAAAAIRINGARKDGYQDAG